MRKSKKLLKQEEGIKARINQLIDRLDISLRHYEFMAIKEEIFALSDKLGRGN